MNQQKSTTSESLLEVLNHRPFSGLLQHDMTYQDPKAILTYTKNLRCLNPEKWLIEGTEQIH